MTLLEVSELHDQVCRAARALRIRKGKDYSPGEDSLSNLKACNLLGICTAADGVVLRMQDKLSRLAALANHAAGEVKEESVTDTVLDLINYSVLFLAVRDDAGYELDIPESEP